MYAQTSRRATRCPVAPFTISTDAGARAWTELLAALEAHLHLIDARPGMLVEHAAELHRRTRGHIASLTNLLDRVCWLAIRTGTETITAGLLGRATSDNAATTSAVSSPTASAGGASPAPSGTGAGRRKRAAAGTG